MSYMVMECHRAYAIVLDSEGRFLKVANLGYSVGQKTDFVIESGADENLDDTGAEAGKPGSGRKNRALTFALAAAACLCLMMFGSYELVLKSIGTINMDINPQVEISVNRLDRVIKAEGINEDGRDLLEGYSAFGKTADHVADELADKAIEMGYLTENGNITITVDSDDDDWKNRTQQSIIYEVQIHIGEQYNVRDGSREENAHTVTLPDGNGGDSSYGESGYGDSSYSTSSGDQTGSAAVSGSGANGQSSGNQPPASQDQGADTGSQNSGGSSSGGSWSGSGSAGSGSSGYGDPSDDSSNYGDSSSSYGDDDGGDDDDDGDDDGNGDSGYDE